MASPPPISNRGCPSDGPSSPQMTPPKKAPVKPTRAKREMRGEVDIAKSDPPKSPPAPAVPMRPARPDRSPQRGRSEPGKIVIPGAILNLPPATLLSHTITSRDRSASTTTPPANPNVIPRFCKSPEPSNRQPPGSDSQAEPSLKLGTQRTQRRRSGSVQPSSSTPSLSSLNTPQIPQPKEELEDQTTFILRKPTQQQRQPPLRPKRPTPKHLPQGDEVKRPPGLKKGTSQSAKDRSKTEKDFLDTEDLYIKELLGVVASYSMPIRHLLGPKISTALFETLTDLGKSHARFRVPFAEAPFAGAPLATFASFLLNNTRLYQKYLDDYNYIGHLVAAMQADSYYSHSLRNIASRFSRSADIKAELGAPVRRMSQYSYYMDSLSACTPEDSEDHEAMVSISKLFKDLQVQFLENAQRRVLEDGSSLDKIMWCMEMSPHCVDCEVENVQYLSTTLGVFLCPDCARCHYQLPRHVSLVEKTELEFLKKPTSWVNHPNGNDITMLARLSCNDTSNAFWEFTLKETEKPTHSSSHEEKAKFITEKYLFRKYVNPDYGIYGKVQREREGKKWCARFMKIEENSDNHPVLNIYSIFEGEVADRVATIPLQRSKAALIEETETITHLQIKDPKGDFFHFNLGSRFRVFTFLFALHRVSEGLCEAPFDTTLWLNSDSWFKTVNNNDIPSISEFLASSPSYAGIIEKSSGQTAAHLAAKNMNTEVLELMVKYEANFLVVDRAGLTPLHLIFKGDWSEESTVSLLPILKALREQGMTFNEQSDQGRVPLHFVLEGPNSHLFPFLLSQEVNLDAQDCEGVTPLLLALREKREKEAWQLVEGGADLFLKTHKGEDTLSAVRSLGNDELFRVVFERFETRRITQTKNIIQEIIDTEQTYADQMAILVFVYKTKISADLPISDRAIRSVFGNIEEINRGCMEFLKDISDVLELPPEKQDVGRRFLRHKKYFESYIEYCIYQTISAKSLGVLLMNPLLREWIVGVENDLACPETLEGYLIKPVQRICRYALLLRELIKYGSEEYEDALLLNEAADFIAKILNQSNEEKRKLDHIEEVVELMASIGVKFSLTSQFIEEGKIRIYTDKYREGIICKYYLFSDVLIIVKGKQSKVVPVSVLLFSRDVPVIWKVKGSDKAFNVIPREKTLKLTCMMESKEERDKIIRSFSAAILPFTLGQADNNATEVKALQRPIFYEEIFADGNVQLDWTCMGRSEVSMNQKLAKRIGQEEEEESLLRSLGRVSDRKFLRSFLERISPMGEKPQKREHVFEKHHFRTPRWCDHCQKFIYGLRHQGNKCRECSYSAHFKCTDKIGSTCLSEYAMRIWSRRDVLEIVTALFRRRAGENELCTLLLFSDTLEILRAHNGGVEGGKLDFLKRAMTIEMEGSLSSVENSQFSMTCSRDQENYWFQFANNEGATHFWEKLSSLLRKPNAKGAQSLSKSSQSPSRHSNGGGSSNNSLSSSSSVTQSSRDRPSTPPTSLLLHNRPSSTSLDRPSSTSPGTPLPLHNRPSSPPVVSQTHPSSPPTCHFQPYSPNNPHVRQYSPPLPSQNQPSSPPPPLPLHNRPSSPPAISNNRPLSPPTPNFRPYSPNNLHIRQYSPPLPSQNQPSSPPPPLPLHNRPLSPPTLSQNQPSSPPPSHIQPSFPPGTLSKASLRAPAPSPPPWSSSSSSSSSSSKAPLQREKSVFVVTANCSYSATTDSELDIVDGQRLIVEKIEGEWWFGKQKDDPRKCGWFPSSYINP